MLSTICMWRRMLRGTGVHVHVCENECGSRDAGPGPSRHRHQAQRKRQQQRFLAAGAEVAPVNSSARAVLATRASGTGSSIEQKWHQPQLCLGGTGTRQWLCWNGISSGSSPQQGEWRHKTGPGEVLPARWERRVWPEAERGAGDPAPG